MRKRQSHYIQDRKVPGIPLHTSAPGWMKVIRTQPSPMRRSLKVASIGSSRSSIGMALIGVIGIGAVLGVRVVMQGLASFRARLVLAERAIRECTLYHRVATFYAIELPLKDGLALSKMLDDICRAPRRKQ